MCEGCKLVPVGHDSALGLLQSLNAGQVAVEGPVARIRQSPGDTLWILAHTDGGVTWGAIDGAMVRLSCKAVPGWFTPPIDPKTLQQLRVFGQAGEVLIWRDEDSRTLFGRVLLDAVGDCEEDVKPRQGYRVVAATRIADGSATTGGFTAVSEGNGRTQVLPLALADADFVPRKGREGAYPLSLTIKEYFERDLDTGCVRIAASRLVALNPPKEK